jgi:hypothetical protein
MHLLDDDDTHRSIVKLRDAVGPEVYVLAGQG